MTTAIEQAIIEGVQLRSWAPGDHYSLCPKCGPTRKPEHRKQRCLHVTIESHPRKVLVFCNHCPWSTAFFDEGEGERGGRDFERKGARVVRGTGVGRRFSHPVRSRKSFSPWRS